MKRILMMAIAACMMTLSAQAQEQKGNTAPKDVFDVVEEMPQYPGGMQAMLSFLQENVTYPKDAQEKKISGRVLVTFVVEKDGSISNVETVKSVFPSLDEEAVRIVKAMPNWKPGKQNGKVVRVKYTLPISFSLN
ncbi:MAG: energy transducer TonB [Prevotella sp.]|nr:energy transducer TonB [Prevotella sp.]